MKHKIENLYRPESLRSLDIRHSTHYRSIVLLVYAMWRIQYGGKNDALGRV